MASNTVAQVQLVLRLTLGLIFLASALAKLRHPTLFVRGVLDYQVLSTPLAGAYGRLLPFIELGTALLLFSGFLLLIAIGLSILILLSFAIAIVVVLTHGRQLRCHCFGEASTGYVGWHTLGRDVLLLLVALCLLVLVHLTGGSAPGWLSTDFGWDAVAFATAALIALTYELIAQGLDVLMSLRHPRAIGERW